jgi:hypothetical protein
MDLREVGFQDIDHEFLFEPEMDGIHKHARGQTYRKPCPLTRRRWFPPWPPQFGYLAYTATQGPSGHHMGVGT